MKLILLPFLAFCFTVSTGHTQKKFVWDSYKIQVTVPDDFRVKKNDNHDFEMKGDGMELSMHIFEQNIAIDELNDATIAGAKEIQMSEIDAATKVKVNELEGYYVEGFKSGHRVMFAGLGDPNSHTNFFLAITFADNDKEAEKAAIEILDSLDVL